MSLPPDADDRPKPDRPPLAVLFLATGAFTGMIPFAPGTIGSLVALLILLVSGATHPLSFGILIGVGFVLGGLAAGSVARHIGNRQSVSVAFVKMIFQPGSHAAPDPSIVVIDEIVGMWISMFMLPPTFAAYACAFVLFRGFDIIKPPPARQLERVGGGWGIMLDDVIAGIYANLVAQLVVRTLIPLIAP